MPDTRIATCCYCGTRAALVLRGETRHELACATCGAPLHELKKIPATKARGSHDAPSRQKVRPVRPKGRRKPRKSLRDRLLDEVWDAIEDIFD